MYSIAAKPFYLSLVLFSRPTIVQVGYKIVQILPAITLLKKGGAIFQLLHKIVILPVALLMLAE